MLGSSQVIPQFGNNAASSELIQISPTEGKRHFFGGRRKRLSIAETMSRPMKMLKERK